MGGPGGVVQCPDMRFPAPVLGLFLLVGCEKTPPASAPADESAGAPAALLAAAPEDVRGPARRGAAWGEIGNYPPPPPGLRRRRCAVLDFEDGTGGSRGAAAAEQMEALATRSHRFAMIERPMLREILKELGADADPRDALRTGRLRGMDLVFIGKITRLVVTASGADAGRDPLDFDASTMPVRVDVGVDLKLVDPSSGEILAKAAGESSREDRASSWGLRVLGMRGKDVQVDQDTEARILRWGLDEAFREMLPSVDEAFSRPAPASCPKCRDTVEAGVPACRKCAPATCPCGAALPIEVRFCGKCGRAVDRPR